jgi:hypothetical protein
VQQTGGRALLLPPVLLQPMPLLLLEATSIQLDSCMTLPSSDSGSEADRENGAAGSFFFMNVTVSCA